MTFITTVAGPTPLLLEKSLQAQVLIPLVTSLAFGPVTVDVAALFLVPAIYVIVDHFGALAALEALAGKVDVAAGGAPTAPGPVHRRERSGTDASG